jgi:DNA-directed RNA polymerase specialized sigma24 family protein
MSLTVDSEGFPRTHWSLVLEAGQGDREALERLCGAYWVPLYAFARRRGNDTERAQDLVQGFLLAFVERDSLAQVSAEGGRFRAYMLTSFKNYSTSQARREIAKKRGGTLKHLSLDWLHAEKGYQVTDPALDAEALYHRQWAIALLQRVEDSLRTHYQRSGREQLFEALHPALRDEAEALNYGEIEGKLAMTRGALRVAVHRLRSRFATLLREEVMLLVDGDDEVDDELRILLGAMR